MPAIINSTPAKTHQPLSVISSFMRNPFREMEERLTQRR
jgi:hypothetical protein